MHNRNLEIIEEEKKAVFFVNVVLILYVIISIFFSISLKYFFYINLILTLILSYIYFKTSKKVSKALILTNMFILFFFLSPVFFSFLHDLFGSKSYIIILLYNIFIASIFLFFSGFFHELFTGIKNFKFKLLLLVALIGFGTGFLFWLIKEPVPEVILNVGSGSIIFSTLSVALGSLIVALSEQIIFVGFLYNSYKRLVSKKTAFYQVSTIFVLFHFLRIESLLAFYKLNFGMFHIIFIVLYYLFLFFFMKIALYLYTFKGKKYSGNFVYPVVLHAMADFTLFFLYLF
ncbi:MAG: type II CAAX prenyl endopeptidase Rce1 family protein [Nanoarchaeota archaeon]